MTQTWITWADEQAILARRIDAAEDHSADRAAEDFDVAYNDMLGEW